jgi:hypothetical protein
VGRFTGSIGYICLFSGLEFCENGYIDSHGRSLGYSKFAFNLILPNYRRELGISTIIERVFDVPRNFTVYVFSTLEQTATTAAVLITSVLVG